MNPKPVQVFTMSSDELSYLVRRFDINIVPGLAENSLISLSESEQELASRIIENSLVARKYLTTSPDGTLVIESQLESVLKLMIRCAYVLVMTTSLTPGAPREVTICFISPNVVISEIFPRPHTHDIAVYMEPLDFAQDIANMIPEPSGGSASIDIWMPRPDWEKVIADANKGEWYQSSLYPNVAVVQQLIAQSAQGIDLSLTSLLGDKLTTKILSVRWTNETSLFATDDDISDRYGEIRIRTMASGEIANVLRAWLAPVQPVKSIDPNG